jgi:hypothetical protein
MFVFLSLDKIYLNLNHVIKIEYICSDGGWNTEHGGETMELYMVDDSQITIDYEDGINAIKEKTGITEYTSVE